jgi:actin-related protein 6
MNNERICIPELLFRPSNIGINQGGVAEAVVASLEMCPEELRGALLSNIVVTGGNTLLPNFAQRL